MSVLSPGSFQEHQRSEQGGNWLGTQSRDVCVTPEPRSQPLASTRPRNQPRLLRHGQHPDFSQSRARTGSLASGRALPSNYHSSRS